MAAYLHVVLSCLLVQGVGGPEFFVYKCRTADGYSYQQAACEGAELERRAFVSGAEDAAVVPPKDAVRYPLRGKTPRPAAAVRAVRQQPAAPSRASACEVARQGRDRAYAKAGLKRDFKMSSIWDNKVHQACR